MNAILVLLPYGNCLKLLSVAEIFFLQTVHYSLKHSQARPISSSYESESMCVDVAEHLSQIVR